MADDRGSNCSEADKKQGIKPGMKNNDRSRATTSSFPGIADRVGQKSELQDELARPSPDERKT